MKRIWQLAFAVFSCSAAMAAPPTAPAIAFEPQAVVISGVTPKGQVLYFSVAREVSADSEITVVRRQDVVTDTDGDGTVRVELGQEVPWKSVWVAVDLTSGDPVASAPAGYPLRVVSWRGLGVIRSESRADQIEDARDFADVLVVRPKVGQWRTTIEDGTEGDDDDLSNHRVAAAVNRLEPIGASPAAPDHLMPTDVVVLIDPRNQELIVVHAGSPTASSAVAEGAR